jgi:hypothetical protein
MNLTLSRARQQAVSRILQLPLQSAIPRTMQKPAVGGLKLAAG